MTVIIILAILVCIAGITFMILNSFYKVNAQKNAYHILQFGRERDYYLYEVLSSAMPKNTVMRRRFFPVRTDKGVFDTEVDIVCVLNSGIAVIDIKGTKGVINAPQNGFWTAEYNGAKNRFANPYEYNKLNVEAVKRALEKKGILNVPVFNYVVFSDEEVKISKNYPWLLKPETMVSRIKALDNKLVLTHRDKQNIINFFNLYSRPKNPPIRPKKPKKQTKKRVLKNENKIKKIKR